VNFQKEYFTNGDETMLKPMILKDIADITGLDISTISRVANSKYIQTHFGIYPLKFFFSEGMETQDGDTVSTREIKSILQECIDSEDKSKPLTDERLAQIVNRFNEYSTCKTYFVYFSSIGFVCLCGYAHVFAPVMAFELYVRIQKDNCSDHIFDHSDYPRAHIVNIIKSENY
jgi:hypothetical protein